MDTIFRCKKLHGKVKYRGGYSQRYPKKSYAVEFSKKISLYDLPTEDDWVLNASYVDKTFMRHKLGFDLFMKMSENNKAPLSSYVVVYENHLYQGLYVLMQKLTANVLGVNKKEGLLFKEPPIFYKGEMHFQEANNKFQQKYPKFKTTDRSDILLLFRDFLLNSNEEDFYKNLSHWMHLENVADWYIMILLANAGDNIVKNFYLYKVDNNTPFKVALWDFDHSFGRDGDGEENLMKNPANVKSSILFMKLLDNPYLDFNRLIEERWIHLRTNNIISVSQISQMTNAYQRQFQSEIQSNEIKWPYNSENYFDENNFKQEIELLKDFIKNRISHLDNLFCYNHQECANCIYSNKY